MQRRVRHLGFGFGVGALAPVAGWAAETASRNAEKLKSFGLAESGGAAPPLGRVLLVFALVACLAWGVTWLLRRYGFKLPGGAIAASTPGAVPLRAIARSTLPGGVVCHVVEAQGRDVLITVTRHGVTSLVLGDAARGKGETP